MLISRSSWHFRVFAWWYGEKHGYEFIGQQVNLCPYVRAVLFWSWPRWVFIEGRIISGISWGVLAAGPIYLAHHFGWVDGLAALLLVYATLLFALLCIGGLMLVEYFGVFDRFNKAGQAAMRPITPFLSLLGAYARALHKKICPLVKVRD